MGILTVIRAAAAQRLLTRSASKDAAYSSDELPISNPSTSSSKRPHPEGGLAASTSLQRPQTVLYGSTSSAPRRDSVLGRVPEDSTVDFHDEELRDEQSEEDWEREVGVALEAQGLYKGSYRAELTRYSAVPISTIVFFVLAAVPPLVYRTHGNNSYPYTAYFPYPLLELILPGALWVLTYVLKGPIYSLCAYVAGIRQLPQYPFVLVANILPILLHSALSVTLRLIAASALLIQYHAALPEPYYMDPAFHRAWWAGVGWAAAESVVAMTLGYRAVSWYRDVLVDIKDVRRGEAKTDGPQRQEADNEQRLEHSADSISSQSSRSADITPRQNTREGGEREHLLRSSTDVVVPEVITAPPLTRTMSEETLEQVIEQDLDELITIRKREEIEAQYGMAFIRIPILVPVLQRLNSLLFSIGSILIISAATFPNIKTADRFSSVAYRPAHVAFTLVKDVGRPVATTSATLPLAPILVAVAAAHAVPTITSATLAGPHVAAYIGLLIGLVVFFAGLGIWGALE